jgi:hypothetical protein
VQLGIHFINFALPGGPAALATTLAETAIAAEAAGCTTFTVMDHWFQMGGARCASATGRRRLVAEAVSPVSCGATRSIECSAARGQKRSQHQVGPFASMAKFGSENGQKRRFTADLTNDITAEIAPFSEQLISSTDQLSTAIARGHFLRNGIRDHRANPRVSSTVSRRL